MTAAVPAATMRPPRARPQLLPALVTLLGWVAASLVLAQPKPAAPQDPVAEIAQWLTGRFSNEAQAPLKGVSPGGGAKQAQDQVHVHVLPASVPALPGRVLYVQWNRDTDEGPVARQRLWALDAVGDGTVALRAASFAEPEAFADALTNLRALETISADDLVAWPDECAIVFARQGDGWLGTTAPKCAITEKSGRTVSLQVRLRVTATGFTYQERSFTGADFTPVLSLPRTGSYEFLKLR